MPAQRVAAVPRGPHTRRMGVLSNRRFLIAAIGAISLTTTATPVSADEIRLKDGKKLYGVIVAYEENMFKVKTDFGYVLVEKDKIASIIPAAPASSEAQPATKNGAAPPKSAPNPPPKAEAAAPSPADTPASASNASAKAIIP